MQALPTPTVRYVILAAVDDSVWAEVVLHQATRLAATTAGAELHLAHVVDSLGIPALVIGGSHLALPSASELLRKGGAFLNGCAESAHHEFSGAVATHLRIGTPWREIVQLATNLEADLVVVGTHEPNSLERLFLGSRAEPIARAAPCPVLIARPKTAHRSEVPEILPPCPDCVAEQRSSVGTRLWCAHHAEHHARAHVYSELPESFAIGSQTSRDV